MLNLHCNNNDKNNNNNKKITKKKNMRLPRFQPGIYRFKGHQGIHYAMEANAKK